MRIIRVRVLEIYTTKDGRQPAEENEKIILLLCGGSKSTQAKDIKNAINYWQDYLVR